MRNWQTNPEVKNEFVIDGYVIWIKLTQGQETCIDSCNWEKVRRLRWYTHKGRRTFYAASGGGIRPIVRMHTLLLAKGADHRDGNGLNNLNSNLRLASTSQQLQNTQKRRVGICTSRFKGVHWSRDVGKWCVQIRHKHVGVFEDEIKAAKIYDEKAKEFFGEFARLNFPEVAC